MQAFLQYNQIQYNGISLEVHTNLITLTLLYNYDAYKWSTMVGTILNVSQYYGVALKGYQTNCTHIQPKLRTVKSV